MITNPFAIQMKRLVLPVTLLPFLIVACSQQQTAQSTATQPIESPSATLASSTEVLETNIWIVTVSDLQRVIEVSLAPPVIDEDGTVRLTLEATSKDRRPLSLCCVPKYGGFLPEFWVTAHDGTEVWSLSEQRKLDNVVVQIDSLMGDEPLIIEANEVKTYATSWGVHDLDGVPLPPGEYLVYASITWPTWYRNPSLWKEQKRALVADPITLVVEP